MSDTDRDALRRTVEGAMSTAEGRWTGNPVDITDALVDFLQWESDKYKARAEAAERKVARVEVLRDEWAKHPGSIRAHCADDLTAALADEENDR